MKLVLMGAPGAGKGTQAKIISEKLGIPAISTGSILREAVKKGTEVGGQVKGYLEKGELVPDDIIINIMRKRIAEPDCKNGYILDGMPRTIVQAQELESGEIDVDAVLFIEISDDEIVERMAGRRSCPECGASFHIESAPPKTDGVCDFCGGKLVIRDDDKPETVKKRLAVYHKQTVPVKEFYKDRDEFMQVENRDGIEATTEAVFEALGI